MLFYGASVLNILNLESRKDDVGCGCATTWMQQSCLNALFDEWRARKAGEPIEETLIAFGTIDWLFREYKQTKAYLEKVSKRSRRDYERTMQLITNLVTKKGALSGPVRSRHSEPVARRYQGQTR
jgi:hypothetical protein